MSLPLNLNRILFGLVVFVALCGFTYYFTITVEDAYISMRYARNFATGSGLVFNAGEPVSAMTSPLHVLLISPLFLLVDDAMWLNKVFGLLAALAAGGLVLSTFESTPKVAVFALAVTILPAPVMFWSVAGLETPFLALAVALAIFVLPRAARGDSNAYFQLSLIAGFAFLLRHDSAVFFAPTLLAIGLTTFSRRTLFSWLAGGSIAGTWIIFSWVYYGDIFPTSFYAKTPNVEGLRGNFQYLIVFLIVTQIGPIAVYLFAAGRLKTLKLLGMAFWASVLGLVFLFAYALTMARTHMMFQMRSVAPYMPAIAFALSYFLKTQKLGAKSAYAGTSLVAVFSLMSVFQIHNTSINSFARNAEYLHVSAPSYRTFMATMEMHARDIEAHWTRTNSTRALRLFTLTEGVIPFRLSESYVFGGLISYRHSPYDFENNQFPIYSDYVHIIAPRNGTIEDQMGEMANAVLISKAELNFDGQREKSLVYWNPNPMPNPLPRRIDGL